MFKRLHQLRDGLRSRRAERSAARGERALRQNEAKAQRIRNKRMEGGKGPTSGPGI
jgi:hypothetical protein